MQTMYANIDGVVRSLDFPEPDEEVLPGIPWGAFDELLTPAYWRGQAWQHQAIGTYACLRLGRTLSEETAACLLGGYGMPAELGLQAYARLREKGLLEGRPSSTLLEAELSEPFAVQGGHRRYRFPRQKARYLAGCLAALAEFNEPDDDSQFRDALARLPGIGPKTASWIVRNYRVSDDVAILDVHILRAGRHIGLFDVGHTPERHYGHLEEAFLAFAEAIATPAGMLDGLIWDYMRRMPARSPSHARTEQLELFASAA
jgi:thermostable 8-oxoguanine DNA glycosylase